MKFLSKREEIFAHKFKKSWPSTNDNSQVICNQYEYKGMEEYLCFFWKFMYENVTENLIFQFFDELYKQEIIKIFGIL